MERFEGFLAGMELCNAFTELNDPLDQESRFLEMGRDYAAGDEERHPMDEDYLRAMRYGMPPNGGFGLGVDRLVMLMADVRQYPRGDPVPAFEEQGRVRLDSLSFSVIIAQINSNRPARRPVVPPTIPESCRTVRGSSVVWRNPLRRPEKASFPRRAA